MIKRDQLKICTLPDMFNDSVVKFGERRCQWFKIAPGSMETSSLNFSEVGMIVRDLSAGLQSLGVTKQDRAAIMAYNCPQWLWSDFAILGAGAATVTIYPSFSAHEMQFIVNDSGSKIIFVRDEESVSKVMGALDQMPQLEKVIIMEENCTVPDHPKFVHLQDVREQGKKYLFKNPYCYEKACDEIKVWDMASIIYTSGTTGNPKGAIHTHSSFMYAVQADNNMFTHNDCMVDEYGVLFSFLPLSHTYERQCGQMQSLNAGCAIAYAEKPQTVVQDLQIFKPTWFCSVPRIFERIYMAIRDVASATPEGKAAFEKAMDIGVRVIEYRSDEDGFIDMGLDVDVKEGLPDELCKEYEWADAAVFSKVRQLLGGNFQMSFSASAGLPANLCKAFLAMGIRVCEGYGLTETMNAVNLSNLKAVLPGSMGSTNYFAEEKLAQDGEILVRGGMLFQGYYNNPEATAEAFDEDGFFHTGDIATTVYNKKLGVDYYKIIDRKKSIMVLDTGKNVPRAKVENRFSTAHYIEQICAVADERKFVGALVVPKFEVVIPMLKAAGVEVDESKIIWTGDEGLKIIAQVGDDIARSPELKQLIDKDIEEANAELEGYEQIKKYHIANRRFLDTLDEITPTLKNKHRVILKNFSKEIEELYK
ncbi:MAG: long-chain fatty acid--CoA ligase [Bacillota bacterium]|nr:long-chain fatty acid--CoA ligase [Bacillota bacterium]